MEHGRELLDSLLAELGAKIAIPELALTRSGTCCFDYKSLLKIVLELPDQSPVVCLYALIMTIPKKGQKKLFKKLLRLNLFCFETNGFTLAITEDDTDVALCYNMPLENLDQARFENVLENFLTTVDILHHRISGEEYLDENEAEAPQERPHGLGSGGFIRV